MKLVSLIRQKNKEAKENYLQLRKQLGQLLAAEFDVSDNFSVYVKYTGERVNFFCQLEEDLAKGKYASLTDWQKLNTALYSELLPENYPTCYANPAYSSTLFGEELGPALAVFYVWLRGMQRSAFEHEIYVLERWLSAFLVFAEAVKNQERNKETLFELITSVHKNQDAALRKISLLKRYRADYDFYKNIILSSSEDDFSYLYQCGLYVSENELTTAKFLSKYPSEKITTMAKALVKSYQRGFSIGRKDITKKKTVMLYYQLGQERLMKAVIRELEQLPLQPLVPTILTTAVNKQFNYDYRFENALYFDRDFVDKILSLDTELYHELKKDLKAYSGPIFVESFGEKPFSPVPQKNALALSDEQQELNKEFRVRYNQLHQKYLPSKQTSFSIIAFPSPEIGKIFESVFEETLAINMLDTEYYESIQQKIVDVLDKGKYIWVKGKNGNETDIKVNMHKLKKPETQTNFLNCGADVNIPLGEVFTSPVLKGTNGVLHVKETFLNSLKFSNLKLVFKDGYVADYSCTNFATEAENKKYVQENLFLPHTTLPLGEFAIGTNTLAYAMAKKYDILSVLPILIIEKMGPHFAIGDTCFSWEEDWKVYNPDKKEIIARDNEKSALRKKDPQNAYTNHHTDITLPYDELDFIYAIAKDGSKYPILENGYFKVEGTEILNEPLFEIE